MKKTKAYYVEQLRDALRLEGIEVDRLGQVINSKVGSDEWKVKQLRVEELLFEGKIARIKSQLDASAEKKTRVSMKGKKAARYWFKVVEDEARALGYIQPNSGFYTLDADGKPLASSVAGFEALVEKAKAEHRENVRKGLAKSDPY